MTKLVHELVEEKLVVENGKIETTGGRRPNVFGLTNSAIYFAGINIGRDSIQFVLTDVQNNIIYEQSNPSFVLTDSDRCLHSICEQTDQFLDNCGVERGKILGIGICIAGRVNPDTGRSYMYFTSSDKSLRQTIEDHTNIRTLVENDTRARCYAEYCNDNQQGGKNLLYLHLGRGVAIGIVTNGKLYYGKSGFAGEFGHTPFFDNEIICACGKKGCLETEVSGIAIEQKIVRRIEQGVNTILREKYDLGQNIHIDDVVGAAKKDDTLSIELIEEAGEKVGKSIAFLINIFNPETVIIGGNLAKAGEFLMLPLKSATNKFSLNLVYKDTKFRFSQMDENAAALGAAMLIRNRIIGVQ
jgi:predicted NBD/HSP70 family sugar kinase